MDKEPSFGNANYWVCFYCKNLRVFGSQSGRFDDGDDYGCSLESDSEGKYPSLIRFESENHDLSLLQEGCGDFLSSGLPAHPVVHREMVKINPLAGTIPIDLNTTEGGFEFSAKVRKHLNPEQVHEDKSLVYRVNTFMKH